MFQLARPNMAVNDPRLRSRFQMWNTWNITTSEARDHIVGWVAEVAASAQGSRLRNLVLHCHGAPGWLQLGQGFGVEHIGLFAAWRGKVEKVWITACQIAEIPTAAGPSGPAAAPSGPPPRDGNLFISGLAKEAGCYVVASTETQCHQVQDVAADMMTSFEGLVLSYTPAGAPDWSARNRSTWFESGPGGTPRAVCMPD